MNKKYLGELIKEDNIEFGRNNLILSPVGSGKTHFIENDLHAKDKEGLMLVSTSSLKESLLVSGGFHETANDGQVDQETIHIMTYNEFGELIAFSDEGADKYDVIYCDEIHSLFDYFSYQGGYGLAAAIKYLFSNQDGKDIYYFTATIDKINEFAERNYKGVLNDVNIYDYRDSKDIVRYTTMFKEEFVDEFGMLEIIDKLEDFGYNGEKGVIFNSRIDGMKRIEEAITSKGYNAISIWSINNSKHQMTDEQLRVRDVLLSEGVIPESYDFIIINGSMREGWNLLDENVELAVLNTKDETDKVQALGRIRKHISMVAVRVDGETPIETKIMRRNNTLGTIDKVLNKELTTDERDKVVDELGIKRDNGTMIKWPTIAKALANNGYKIDIKRVRRDGKQLRVTVITKVG